MIDPDHDGNPQSSLWHVSVLYRQIIDACTEYCTDFFHRFNGSDHLLGLDVDRQKKASALFILKLKENHWLSQLLIDNAEIL